MANSLGELTQSLTLISTESPFDFAEHVKPIQHPVYSLTR